MLQDQAAVDSFTEFVEAVEPRLRNALVPTLGVEAAREATADALAYGWEHWERLGAMENPAGSLYRVAQTSARRARRKPQPLPPVQPDELPWVEPGLPHALADLSHKQRISVWLVHGMGWQYKEVAELLGVSADTIRTHTERGMRKLSRALGGTT